MPADFDAYIKALRAVPFAQHTEHTGRAALEAVLNAFRAESGGAKGMTVQHEPKQVSGKGAPDFKIARHGMILGYVEVKAVGAPLDAVLKSDQIKRYRTLSDNIVLTDYLEFIWLGADGKPKARERLAYLTDLEGKTVHLKPERVDAVSKLLAGFFSVAPAGLGSAQALALALAHRARLLRDALAVELTRQKKEHQEGKLFALYDVFRKQVFQDLEVTAFADAFAQMLAYGLFLAKLNAKEDEAVTLNNVEDLIPGSFRLIRELVEFLGQLKRAEYEDARWIVDEVLSIVNSLDLAKVRADLSFRGRRAANRNVRAGDQEEHRLFERDPFIYFYEDFLKAYDKDTRKGRGVYYTPPPVVNFIVRAVDDILKDTFGIADGLADKNKVTVLDFATGTGTFLLEVFERALANVGGPESGKAGPLVAEHLTKNVFGFEYLIAPYTIAHLKLSQYLRDKGHPLAEDQRLQVFLTNTLEPIKPQRDFNYPAISQEVEDAQKIKDRDILVIVGNPPYSGHSKNNAPSVKATIDGYTTQNADGTKTFVPGYKHTVERRPDINSVDGLGPEEFIPLGERNPKWLNDDYVKFIRFAQLKIDAVEEGVVGIITNHSWLDNPTFRGMRQSLMRSFDQIHVLDLHGSSKPKEHTPDGGANEPVFDITKGVCITLLIKRRGPRVTRFAEVWGTRLHKYQRSASMTLTDKCWSDLSCFAPYYMLRPVDWTEWDSYEPGWSLSDSLNTEENARQIFSFNVLGFQTHRDHFAISFDKADAEKKFDDLIDTGISDEALRKRYALSDNRDWNVAGSRSIARSQRPIASALAYRPFDERWGEHGYVTMDYPRTELIDHVARQRTLSLLVPRQVGGRHWQHVSITSLPAESCYIDNETKSQNYVFPSTLAIGAENLTPAFRAYLDARFEHHYSPEDILGYIYAVLHAPTYRTRYGEFLRIDFPRVPFPETRPQFEALAALGAQLIDAHLLRKGPHKHGWSDRARAFADRKLKLADFHGKGTQVVDKVTYLAAEDGQVAINPAQSFAPMPEDVWTFRIGGYQVLDKYLKSRKGRTLSLDEINHVARVADTLAFTIEQMARIDAAYLAAFPPEAVDKAGATGDAG
jgi:hypothetical protein